MHEPINFLNFIFFAFAILGIGAQVLLMILNSTEGQDVDD